MADESQSDSVNVFRSLQRSTRASDLINHHKQVETYYLETFDQHEINYRYVRGKPYTDKQLTEFRRKSKAPVSFNYIKDSERTILGTFAQQRYDVKFSPREPSDQKLSDLLEARYKWEAYQLGFEKRDIDLMATAWTTGSANQDVFIRYTPGAKPVIAARNQNPFAIYWDPNSRDLGDRKDAQFVDRVSWMSEEDLEHSFPEFDFEERDTEDTTNGYDKTDVFADRSHESMDEKNGLYKVIERIYKVRESEFYTFDEQEARKPVKDVKEFRRSPEGKGRPIFSVDKEFLYVAIACPAKTDKYLYNDKYHCQPRNQLTQELLWPIVELVADSTGSEPVGFVEHMISPSQLINSLIAQVYHAARHSVSGGFFVKRKYFKTETEAKNFDKYHSDPDRNYAIADDAVQTDAPQAIPRGQGISQDAYQLLEHALAFIPQVSSTTPAMKGQQESSSTAASLNAQRLQQSFTMLQGVSNNYKDFCRRRAELIFAYWVEYKEFFKNEWIRILEKKSPGDPEFIQHSMEVPRLDAAGEWDGTFELLNDPTALVSDIVFTDSFKSPTVAERVRNDIVNILSQPGVQQDPVLFQMLTMEYIRLADAPQDLKDKIQEHSTFVSQQAQQSQAVAQQGAELQNLQTMQGIAQTEAMQTMGASPQPVNPSASTQSPLNR